MWHWYTLRMSHALAMSSLALWPQPQPHLLCTPLALKHCPMWHKVAFYDTHASCTSFTLPTWPKPCANEVAKHNHPTWACHVTDPPTASCYQPPNIVLTFWLLGGCFNYGADILTVGWMFELWGRCFDHEADVSTVGCVYQHWDGRFYCIPTLYLDLLLYSWFLMYTDSLNIECIELQCQVFDAKFTPNNWLQPVTNWLWLRLTLTSYNQFYNWK